jgi:hypothetical protein
MSNRRITIDALNEEPKFLHRSHFVEIKEQLENAQHYGDAKIRQAIAIGIARNAKARGFTLEDYLMCEIVSRNTLPMDAT